VVSDCSAVVNIGNRDKESREHHKRIHASTWREVRKAEVNAGFLKVKSHRTLQESLQLGQQSLHVGNKVADVFAGRAAKQGVDDWQLRVQIDEIRKLRRRLWKKAVQVLETPPCDKDNNLWMPKKLPQDRRPRRRQGDVREHQLTWAGSLTPPRWACVFCGLSTTKGDARKFGSETRKDSCMGIQVMLSKVHHTHGLWKAENDDGGNVLFCSHCTRSSTHRVVALQGPCSRKSEPSRLRKLERGLHPDVGRGGLCKRRPVRTWTYGRKEDCEGKVAVSEAGTASTSCTEFKEGNRQSARVEDVAGQEACPRSEDIEEAGEDVFGYGSLDWHEG